MDDDDFDLDVDVGNGGQRQVQCDHCGSDNVFTNAIGELVCLECGTQSQDVRNMQQEELDGGGIVRGRGGGAVMRRQKRLRTSEKPILAVHAFNTTDFLDCVQSILLQQISALVSRCGLSSKLAAVAKELWGRYLARWDALGAPMVEVISGRLLNSGQPLYIAKCYSEGKAPPPMPPISLLLGLGLLYTGCRWLQCPALAHDVCAWVCNGTLPYLNAYASLTSQQQVLMRSAFKFFSPTDLPTPTQVERAAIVFGKAVGIDPLPVVNTELCMMRMVRRAGLPETVTALAIALHALDRHDREHESAYTIHQYAKDKRTGMDVMGKPDLRRNQLLELRDLCVDADGGAGIAIAALVLVAARMHVGWEAWVDAHLQPGLVGSVTAKADRAGVPNADVISGCSSSAAGAPPSSSSGAAATDLPCGSSGVPATSPDAPSLLGVSSTAIELASSAPDTLARYADSLRKTVLAGGEVGFGRAGHGYEPAAYNSTASVTVADPIVAKRLERRTTSQKAAEAAAEKVGDMALVALLQGGAGASSSSSSSAAAGVESSSSSSGGGVAIELQTGPRLTWPDVKEPNRRLGLWPPARLADISALSGELQASGGLPLPALQRPKQHENGNDDDDDGVRLVGTLSAAEARKPSWARRVPYEPLHSDDEGDEDTGGGKLESKRDSQGAGAAAGAASSSSAAVDDAGGSSANAKSTAGRAPQSSTLAAVAMRPPELSLEIRTIDDLAHILSTAFVSVPRLRQPISDQPHLDAKKHRGVPPNSLRPLSLPLRCRALVDHLAALVEASPDQLLLRSDALELVLELYTPLSEDAHALRRKTKRKVLHRKQKAEASL